jgi:cardiolipin synthase A/B
MSTFAHLSTVVILLHALIVIVITVRVIMRRPPTGVAMAWLFLVAMLPLIGPLIYFFIGERRIGHRRKRGIGTFRTDYRKLLEAGTWEHFVDVDWSRHPAAAHGMDRLGRKASGDATVTGSAFKLFSDTGEILQKITHDVDSAKTSVLMEFYIWNEGGAADEVLAALMRAAGRGVSCRLLVDAIGGVSWWKGTQPKQLADAGVMVLPALPVGALRTLVGRTDLRLHRKIVVVDGEVAWTGSMNLVDPRFFKQGAGVGEWVDAMVRLQGAVVAPLAATMISDWTLESKEPVRKIIESSSLHLVKSKGPADIQVIPSGPGETSDCLLQMLLALINAAENELVLTTPYLAPDESMIYALRGAAGRGVTVKLIVPEKVDSFLTRYASRSYYDELVEMGVEIHLYRSGLLHTKSITVDDSMSMFGTVNLDMRSLWINYEVALFVYDHEFTVRLRALQQNYLDDADQLNPKIWKARRFHERFLENTLRLASPLL